MSMNANAAMHAIPKQVVQTLKGATPALAVTDIGLWSYFNYKMQH